MLFDDPPRPDMDVSDQHGSRNSLFLTSARTYRAAWGWTRQDGRRSYCQLPPA
jgi:hypothetical protein